jgi:flagellar basal body P-ring formation protein FlgA
MVMSRLLACALVLVSTASATAQTAPVLRSDILVSAAVVRIGDLVENAGSAANIAVFRAPDLGETGSVPARRVIEALRPHDVVALDTNGVTDIAVTRASRAIGSREMQDRIAKALAGHFPKVEAANVSVTFDRPFRTLHVEPDLGADLTVSRLAFDPRSGRFDILFELPGSAATRKAPLRFSGTAGESYEAATLVRAVARGEILRAGDLVIERRQKHEITDAVRDTETVIGFAARQPLRAGQVLKRADIGKPELVQRNETILIEFDSPGISLTLRGKALDSGGEGDTVNVINLQSKRNLQGIVSGPGRVKVVSMTPRVTTDPAQMSTVTGAAPRP